MGEASRYDDEIVISWPELHRDARYLSAQLHERGGWSGIIAPAGTPPDVVARLQRDINKLFLAPEFKETVVKQGADITGTSPEAFAAFLRTEADKWSRVIKTSGIQLNQ